MNKSITEQNSHFNIHQREKITSTRYNTYATNTYANRFPLNLLRVRRKQEIKALFRSLEGRGGEGFGKKEGASGRNRRH